MNKKLLFLATLGCLSTSLLSACSIDDNNSNQSDTNNEKSSSLNNLSSSKQKAAINNMATAYLQQKGNLLAIQANKKIEVINHKNKTNYPLPYTQSTDGNYWSWYTYNFLPNDLIKQVMQLHQDDDNNEDYAKSFDLSNFNMDTQQTLMNHNVNYGVNFGILSNIVGIHYLDYQSNEESKVNTDIQNNLAHNDKINQMEIQYLQSINDKAHKANQQAIKYNKNHKQKMSIPYIKYSDGNYWSWFINHSLPNNILKYIYKQDKDLFDNDDVNTSMNIKQANVDIQYNLMLHGVSHGVNFSITPIQMQQQITSYQNENE